MRKTSTPFKPRARLLLELGNQLIKDEGIALFELVKNAYDADATDVKISLKNIDSISEGKIKIVDNGSGMDWDIITKVWLEPGTDYRESQVILGLKTKCFKRLPLGQKGVGRFGAHKLGRHIKLVTRICEGNEIVVIIDWNDFQNKKYLEEVPIDIYEREPEVFKGNSTGTQINISGLWNSWTRGMVRDVYRAVNSICSPFKSPDSFKAVLEIEDKNKSDWLKGLFGWKEAVNYKLFKASCYLENDELSYTYEFVPWDTMTKINGRKVDTIKEKKIFKIYDDDSNEAINLADYKIGKINIDLYIFDLDSNVLALGVSDKKGLKDFLKFNGGLRVYRDGVRVYDYGELGNDWLDLGGRRVNIPSARLSNNLIIGAVSLNRFDSIDLEEKTNREGFIENEAVKKFRSAVLFAFTQITAERNTDKSRIRKAYSKGIIKEPVIDTISELRTKIDKKGLIGELGGYLNRIEEDYKDIREKLLTSAGAGLSLSIVIHEIDKIIKELKLAVEMKGADNRIKSLVKHLADLIQGYAMLVKISGKVNVKASKIIEESIFNVGYRLLAHNIKLINNSTKENDFTINCSKRLILGAVMNILDNSIYWLETKRPKIKYIYITPTKELNEGFAIVIGDNGSGFFDPLDNLVQPFFTRKSEGMGLGLHIVNEIMKVHKGHLKIIEKGEIKLPKDIDGAVISLIFKGVK